MAPPKCIECGDTSRLVTGADIYRHRPDLYDNRYWLCNCGAYCGTHKGTTDPLGYPCGPATRRARSAAHDAFDRLWRGRFMPRAQAYSWLAGELGVHPDACHIGMFDAPTALRTRELAQRKLAELVLGA